MVKADAAPIRCELCAVFGVVEFNPHNHGWIILDQSEVSKFDAVIKACHGETGSVLLKEPEADSWEQKEKNGCAREDHN